MVKVYKIHCLSFTYLSIYLCLWFFRFIYFILFYKNLCVLVYMYVYSLCVGADRDRKRTSDPLKLELEAVVNYHVGAGNWILSVTESLHYQVSPISTSLCPLLNTTSDY